VKGGGDEKSTISHPVLEGKKGREKSKHRFSSDEDARTPLHFRRGMLITIEARTEEIDGDLRKQRKSRRKGDSVSFQERWRKGEIHLHVLAQKAGEGGKGGDFYCPSVGRKGVKGHGVFLFGV